MEQLAPITEVEEKETETINILDETDDEVVVTAVIRPLKRKCVEELNNKIKKKKLSDSIIEIDASPKRKPSMKDIACSPIVLEPRASKIFNKLNPMDVLNIEANNNNVKKNDLPDNCKEKIETMFTYFQTFVDKTKDKIKEVQTDVAKPSTSKIKIPPADLNCSIYKNTREFISENIHVDTMFRMVGLRPIVIDGSNIAMSHSMGKHFSVNGLKLCIDFFLKRQHRVYAFIPQFRLKYNQSDNPRLLQKLLNEQLVFCTASRELMSGKKICSYDDRILVQAAAAMRAVIVSSDNYRDLLKEDPRLRHIIESSLLMPTWVNDMLIFPDDPLGRYGPNLQRFLTF